MESILIQLKLTTCLSLNSPLRLNQNTKRSLLMARFEEVIGVCNQVLGDLKFVVFCTSPRFGESKVTGRKFKLFNENN